MFFSYSGFMIEIDDKLITASVFDIVQRLKIELITAGSELLDTIKVGPQDLHVTCPVHKSGMERSPSCGISLIDKRIGDKKIPAGTVHCFTCGYTGSIDRLISYCFGYENADGSGDGGDFGKKWLISRFLAIEIDDRVDYLDFEDAPVQQEQSFVSQEELSGYRFYHPYMYQRGMTDELIAKFDVGFDKETDCITLPVCDGDGNCVFIARRSVVGKYFNYPSEADKPLYGLHHVPKDCKELIVCESIFNCISAWRWGRPAIALLGTGSDYQIEELKKLNVRHFILGLDPDDAGRKGAQRIKRRLRGKLFTELDIPKGKDINDLTEEEFKNLPEFI